MSIWHCPPLMKTPRTAVILMKTPNFMEVFSPGSLSLGLSSFRSGLDSKVPVKVPFSSYHSPGMSCTRRPAAPVLEFGAEVQGQQFYLGQVTSESPVASDTHSSPIWELSGLSVFSLRT